MYQLQLLDPLNALEAGLEEPWEPCLELEEPLEEEPCLELEQPWEPLEPLEEEPLEQLELKPIQVELEVEGKAETAQGAGG